MQAQHTVNRWLIFRVFCESRNCNDLFSDYIKALILYNQALLTTPGGFLLNANQYPLETSYRN